MQKKFMLVVIVGFALGLGLAACATPHSSRNVASDLGPRYSSSQGSKDEKPACQAGEERNAQGDCERPFNFDRPFRRGGR